MIKKILIILNFILISTLVFSSTDKLKIYTSILPQKYFVEKIGGDKVIVDSLVKKGMSPETFKPTTKDIIALSQSKIYFTIGLEFEEKFKNKLIKTIKDLIIVDISKDIKKRKFKSEAGEHHRGIEDPHIWMSPILVKQEVKHIYNTLIQYDTNNKEYYTKNYIKFLNELDELNNFVKSKLDKYNGKVILVYHPSFGYFTDEYGLIQNSIEVEGKEPTSRELFNIINQTKKYKINTIFTQPEFSLKSAKIIANAINGKMEVINPLEYDYINNIKNITLKIEESLK
ncbi:zinc transport system substrate-binding protein [Hypnocyclicus thermotrophus]|uniref:Zinc transport system substrate-binding protein n=1 Tax=Hypnocyclicus thermotrophus TaxID=1627895 RepID=A0AA46DZ43_9FUSO|nr:zinc ABC transporter substrate-binding protein [Hypnocyclicus thermotrophus]TDT71425.1 zinc transport system substrate-binding protein [Hypnocyclicus thermotrophus]